MMERNRKRKKKCPLFNRQPGFKISKSLLLLFFCSTVKANLLYVASIMFRHNVIIKDLFIQRTRFYSTKTSLTQGIEPIKSFSDKDGVTEVYIVRRSKLGKHKSRKTPSLSQRLKNIVSEGEWKEVPKNLVYKRVEPPAKTQVPTLAHGLEKILFNPGVHYLKDPRTKYFNFTPYLENITQPFEFDYDALQSYITSSKDKSLRKMARDMNKTYVGSTSSVSAVLSHFYFAMSNFKPVDTSCLSSSFKDEPKQFTRGTRVPASIYLRWKEGVYAIDVDKSYDVDESVLSVMGKSLEKVLTLEPQSFEKYLKENSSQLTEEERNQPESYAYGQMGKFLLRSQLDCYDSRLPRGTFDLKTRAAMPVRLDLANYKDYLGYSLKRSHGLYGSFEREYYDMIRSAFLKYSFQVRIGHMDGILVAYHNTRKIFGFQYISREEMDSRLFGSSKLGDQVFRNALVMFESVLDKATQKYPQQTLRLSFETRPGESGSSMLIYAEAVPEEEEEETESYVNDEFFQTNDAQKFDYNPYEKLSLFQLKSQSLVNGRLVQGPLTIENPARDKWIVRTQLNEIEQDEDEKKRTMFRSMRKKQAMLYSPRNKSPILKMFKRMSEQGLREEELENKA
ncbi:mitochondrial protein Pet127-domain-containing protein [Gilbertella persicaria]|uniref:mitochondrial protein Pet127-domain-containing protein n=1 Tax=Gilbertella persicaria TaxID=101096 RepID=UPI00221E5722|nr:mitochondrial protein Pet127-domain-containing protein [Gilbertella persicaria]KAI8065385.1 mitochondrial protein Pet127-domain-containing protein [Gilbertella persicaria]